MSNAKLSWFFTMMITGIFLMYVGFSGYHVSYLSIIEVFQGDRLITDLFKPRPAEPIKRIQFDLNDTKSYYTTVRYHQSLTKSCKVLLKNYSKQDVSQLLQSLPTLDETEKAYYATRRYAKESSEEYEIAKYLNGPPSECKAYRFNLLERIVFSAVKNIDKTTLVQQIKNTKLLLNYNATRVQVEFAIFEFGPDDYLTKIVSR